MQRLDARFPVFTVILTSALFVNCGSSSTSIAKDDPAAATPASNINSLVGTYFHAPYQLVTVALTPDGTTLGIEATDASKPDSGTISYYIPVSDINVGQAGPISDGTQITNAPSEAFGFATNHFLRAEYDGTHFTEVTVGKIVGEAIDCGPLTYGFPPQGVMQSYTDGDIGK